MTETIIPVKLSGSLLLDVFQEADRSGMSVESWLIDLAAERIRDKAATERFFSRSPQPSDGHEFLKILRSTRDHPPESGDERIT